MDFEFKKDLLHLIENVFTLTPTQP